MHPDDYPFETHCEMLATTGGGKSKGAEHSARECVNECCSTVVLDWKSSLCKGLLAWLAYYRPQVPIVDFQPAGKYVVPFNVFACPTGEPEEHAVRMSEVLLKAQGDEKASDFPMYRETLPMLLAWCAVTGETVQSASRLLHFHNRALSLTAAEKMKTDHLRAKWEAASFIKTERDWDYRFGSTRRKLEPFLHEGPLRRFTSTPGCVDFTQLREQSGIFLADLSGFSEESARIFAALILSRLLHASLSSDEEIPQFVFLDEPQEYETADMVSLLNLSRSSGMRLTLIHHRTGQWKDKATAMACEVNARIKYVMHGVPYDECEKLAETHFLPQLNERWHKQAKYYTDVSYLESEAESITERDDGTVSNTVSSRLIPVHERILEGYEDYTREEKLSMLTEPLVTLAPREYCKFTPDGAEFGEFPEVKDYTRLLTDGEVLQFRESLHPPCVIHAPVVPKTEEASVPERSRNAPRAKRAKVTPANLFTQS